MSYLAALAQCDTLPPPVFLIFLPPSTPSFDIKEGTVSLTRWEGKGDRRCLRVSYMGKREKRLKTIFLTKSILFLIKKGHVYNKKLSISIFNFHQCACLCFSFFGAILSFTPCPLCQPESALQKQSLRKFWFSCFFL